MEHVTQKDDCEIIEVPNQARDKVKIVGTGSSVDMNSIARAEAALEELSSQFEGWVQDEVDKLAKARDAVREAGLAPPHDEVLFRAAHDIKGQGDTLGYPLAAMICASLCKLLDCPADKSAIPLEIIDSHVDAVRRLVKDGITDANHPMGRAVAERLTDVVLEYVEHEESKRKAQDA